MFAYNCEVRPLEIILERPFILERRMSAFSMYVATVMAIWLYCVSLVASFGLTSTCMSSKCDITMKIFDWKKRDAFKTYEVAEDYVLKVNTIFPIPGSRQKWRRVGRGISAGQGKSCGTGQHGQNSRSGAGTRPGFEGGQTPLYRRLPKYVGKPMFGHRKPKYTLIKLEHLNTVAEGSTVDFAELLKQGIVTKINKRKNTFKVVGGAELTVKGLQVRAHAFTESARQAIEANGGSCITLSKTRHIPIEEALADSKAKRDANLMRLKEFRALKAKRNAAKALV